MFLLDFYSPQTLILLSVTHFNTLHSQNNIYTRTYFIIMLVLPKIIGHPQQSSVVMAQSYKIYRFHLKAIEGRKTDSEQHEIRINCNVMKRDIFMQKLLTSLARIKFTLYVQTYLKLCMYCSIEWKYLCRYGYMKISIKHAG